MAQRLVERNGEHVGTAHSLEAGELTIGRSAENDVVLASPYASRQHARVRWADGRYLLEDLGSRNGVAVNGEPLAAPRPLRPGDVIAVPGLELVFDVPDETLTLTTPVAGATRAVRVDRERAEVWVHGRAVELTAKEYLALLALDEHGDRLVSKEELAARVWPEYHGEVGDYNIEAVVARLRRKLEAASDGERYLVTVRGRGYRLMG